MILYLHGFRSSPASYKARLLEQAMRERGRLQQWMCPQLPASPREAAALAHSLAAPHGTGITLIGSSLGGYYATWLAEQLGCRAILLNPAVRPSRELAIQVGEHAMYHSADPFVFRPEYVDELNALAVSGITQPERYFLLAATGDEVLDYREMLAFYPGARQCVIQGSDHGLTGFEHWLPDVLSFAGVPERAS